MTVNQMRVFLKERYPNSSKWKKKVDKMHDEQVIAIYTNPYIKTTLTDKNLINKDNSLVGYFIHSGFNVSDPDYTICPHCGARLDIDEHCDCYGRDEGGIQC